MVNASMRYVALLRGINVGGNNKVEMSKLKAVFESLGYDNVKTYINSGNVLFDADAKDDEHIVEEIERVIKKRFGFAVRVLIRDAANIKKLCKLIPSEWKNDAVERTDVIFLWKEFDSKTSVGEIAITPGVDTLKYISGAIVWNFKRKDYNKSRMHKFIGTRIYKNMTARNVNTVRKLLLLLG